MKKNVSCKLTRIVPIVFILSALLTFTSNNISSAGTVEEPVNLSETGCDHGTGKEEAIKFVASGKANNWNFKTQVDLAKAVLQQISAGQFDNMDHFSSVIEKSLYKWACDNGYKLKEHNRFGTYFYSKPQNKDTATFVGVFPDGYLPGEGLRQGRASLPLDVRGRESWTYCLQVIITRLKHAPDEKISTAFDEKAQKIIDDIVKHSYIWGEDYYSTLIKEVDKQDK